MWPTVYLGVVDFLWYMMGKWWKSTKTFGGNPAEMVIFHGNSCMGLNQFNGNFTGFNGRYSSPFLWCLSCKILVLSATWLENPRTQWRVNRSLGCSIAMFDDLRVNFLGNPLNLSFGTAKKHVFC